MRTVSYAILAAATLIPLVRLEARPESNESPPLQEVKIDTKGLQPIDVQVVASKNYILLADTGHVLAFTKTGEPVKIPTLAQIFARFVAPDDPNNPRPENLNVHLFENERDPSRICVTCMVEDPVDHRKNSTENPTSSCISELYDTRIGYDSVHDRFWIACAARNHIWERGKTKPPPNITPNPDVNRPECVAKLARRFIFTAFSRDENPANGFPFINVVTHDYSDWPLASVLGPIAVFTHADSKVLRVYDADRLASDGAKLPLGTYTSADYETHALMPVRHHGNSDALFIIALKKRNEFVLRGMSPQHKGRLLKSAPVVLRHNVPMIDAVYRNKRIHLVGIDGNSIRYLSFSVVVSPAGEIQTREGNKPVDFAHDGAGVRTCLLQDPDGPTTVIYDSPSVEVGEEGDVIIEWRAYGANSNGTPVPTGTRYAVWYHDEPEPRRYGVLRAGDPASSNIKPVKIDFARGWIDEDDQRSMWIAGVASDADQRDDVHQVIRRPLRFVVGKVTP